jgi:hypothetical protein
MPSVQMLPKWATIALCSSNASFYDKLSSLKSTPDGEFMRLLEYKIELTGNLTKEEADETFNRLYDNYGHAGVSYAKYLVSDLEAAIDLVMQVSATLRQGCRPNKQRTFLVGYLCM